MCSSSTMMVDGGVASKVSHALPVTGRYDSPTRSTDGQTHIQTHRQTDDSFQAGHEVEGPSPRPRRPRRSAHQSVTTPSCVSSRKNTAWGGGSFV